MGEMLLPLYVLMGFMLIAALIAVETRDLLSSVLCLGAVGFGLALVDLVLKAPDLALTQVVVEIFAVVLLIRTVVAREDTTKEFLSDTPHVALVGAVTLGIMAASFVCFQELEPFSKPPMHMGQAYLGAYVVEGDEGGGARQVSEGAAAEDEGAVPQMTRPPEFRGPKNLVTAVLLDFRAYDTLGEATVIFTAIIGCYALLRTRGREEE